ncbi:MAG: hypothetical protein MZV63_37565 [Marinilabiliales bacterium]|nr:hypothetical protein [Marinilabiliales bacterium]
MHRVADNERLLPGPCPVDLEEAYQLRHRSRQAWRREVSLGYMVSMVRSFR